MNKKITLYYFLISLIVIIISITYSSYASLVFAKFLFNKDGMVYEYITFSPGYDFGSHGPFVSIPVEFVVVPSEYNYKPNEGPPVYDYGMIRMNFKDQYGYKLQQFTGANGWRLNVEG